MCVRKILCYNYLHMGEATRDLVWLIGVFIVVGIIWLLTGGPARPTEKDKPFLKSPLDEVVENRQNTYYSQAPSSYQSSDNQSNASQSGRSQWSEKIRLSLGNAQYEIQPMNEYVTLYSQSQTPINISGWKLVSSRQKVAYQPATVLIPLGRKLFDPLSTASLAPIILEQGDQAYIITGKMPALSPYVINASFKKNICSGYLEELPNYQFTPSLYSNCPRAVEAPGAKAMDDDCYEFIERLGSCHTPEFHSVRNYQGEMEDGYVDDTPYLSSNCQSYLKSMYNYPACVARNKDKANFFDKTWYIYLDQKYELWGEKRETISLYDSQGLLVDKIEY